MFGNAIVDNALASFGFITSKMYADDEEIEPDEDPAQSVPNYLAEYIYETFKNGPRTRA